MSTRYCPECGEAAPRARDLTLRGLLSQLVQALTSIDSRLVRSLRSLVLRPGALAEAYLQGRRKAYLGPIQLFLLVNALFFAVESLTNTTVFASTLDSHLHHQDWSSVAQSLVGRRLERSGSTLEAYAPVFDKAVVLNAKTLIIVMVLPFTLCLQLAFRASRRPFGAHAVFALHLYAFLLLLFCVSAGLSAADVRMGGEGLRSARVDNVLSLFNLAACVTYLYVAIGVVYHAPGAIRVVKAASLAVAVACIVLGYRFALFVITLYTT